MNDIEFINEYRKMKDIGQICKENNIDQSNVKKGSASKEKIHIVAKEIEKEIMKMYGLVLIYNKEG